MHEVAVQMDDQNKNLLLATALSFLVILGWYFFFPPPEEAPQPAAQVTETTATPGDTSGPAAAPSAGEATAEADAAATAEVDAAEDAPRLAINTPRVEGSISLKGGRIDDLRLKDYRETLDDDSPIVTLLSPAGQANAYYAPVSYTHLTLPTNREV